MQKLCNQTKKKPVHIKDLASLAQNSPDLLQEKRGKPIQEEELRSGNRSTNQSNAIIDLKRESIGGIKIEGFQRNQHHRGRESHQIHRLGGEGERDLLPAR